MMECLRNIILIFFSYSIIGWLLEVINCYGWYGKIVNRGFLVGPYCPIYGCGAVLMTLMIPESNDLLSVFLKGFAICSILEYITSYLMEKIFKTRWWDYSKKKFNLNGRVCLGTAFLFGIGGVAIIKVANPIIMSLISIVPDIIINIILAILVIIFIVDIIVSYHIISHIEQVSKDVKKDSTEEVTNIVRKTLKDQSILDKRLVNSFPNFKIIIQKYDKKIEKQKQRVRKETEKLKKMQKKRKNHK